MSFQPILPTGGLVGWAFLQRTMPAQTDAFSKSPEVIRDTQYFEDNIGSIDTAEDLVSDRRLLRVALGAFGLSEDIDNRFFIRKILEEGTLEESALANRLSDKRYKDLASAFGFGDFDTPRTKLSTFGNEISEAFRTRQFEVAVGLQDESMRLALNAKRELSELGQSSAGNDAKWFLIMGSAPLRKVFETALGLPDSFSQLDLDRQLETLKARSKAQFGTDSINEFDDPQMQESLTERYLLMAQLSLAPPSSSAQIALTLLQT